MTTISTMLSSLPESARPRRPHIVLGALVASMTLVGGALFLVENHPGLGGVAPAAAALEPRSAPAAPVNQNLIKANRPLESGRWAGIVIHHSGSPAGSLDSIARQHEAAGLKCLGYHFIISNGQGAPDGQISPGPRWLDQLPGAHAKGPASEALNRKTIGICLVGDGESRTFTDAQIDSLARLVAQLQKQFNIPATAVVLHRDVASTSSPGRLFPEAAFRSRLATMR